MTCHDALTLLEEYVDKELPIDKETLLNKHFEGCSGCRQELEAALLLKELLQSHTPPDPGEAYWSETTRIIIARTVETPRTDTVVTSIADRNTMQRTALFRSVVSVAASLVILFSALLLGSGQEERMARLEVSRPPVLYAASLDEVIGSDNTVILTREENARIARGMLLMGAPGILGRFGNPYGSAAITN